MEHELDIDPLVSLNLEELIGGENVHGSLGKPVGENFHNVTVDWIDGVWNTKNNE